jgi:LEA14-like dessication related protein
MFDKNYQSGRAGLLVRLLCFLGAMGLSGCAVQEQVKPGVSLVNIEVGDVNLNQTGATISLRFDNPAPQDFKVFGSKHELSLNGEPVGTALDNSGFVIPRLGSTKRDIKLPIDNINLLTRVRKFMQAPKVEYVISSFLYSSGGSAVVQIQKSETLSLDQIGKPLVNKTGGKRFDPDEFRLVEPEEIDLQKPEDTPTVQ